MVQNSKRELLQLAINVCYKLNAAISMEKVRLAFLRVLPVLCADICGRCSWKVQWILNLIGSMKE